MSELRSTIAARFNGHDVWFRLPRGGRLQILEDLLGDSAFATMVRLNNGEWKAREIEIVLGLSFAAHQETGTANIRQVVQSAIKRRPAFYAALAALVLVAGLMGVRPEDAVFTDEEEAS